MQTLHDLEMQEIEEIIDLEDAAEQFKIKDLETLNWALRKMAALEKEQAEIDDLAKKEMERIKEWKEIQSRKFEHRINFFEGLITAYAIEQRNEKGDKFKTVKTPFGSVGYRKQQPKWEYRDETKIVEHLKQNGFLELVRVKEEVDKTEFKKRFSVTDTGLVVDENGEPVEGVAVVPQEDKLNIKVGD